MTVAVLRTFSTLTETAAATPTSDEPLPDSELEVLLALDDSELALGMSFSPSRLALGLSFTWALASSSEVLPLLVPLLSPSFEVPPADASVSMVLFTTALDWTVAVPYIPSEASPTDLLSSAFEISSTTATPTDTPIAVSPDASASAVVVTVLVWSACMTRPPMMGTMLPVSVPKRAMVVFSTTATATDAPTATSSPFAPFTALVSAV